MPNDGTAPGSVAGGWGWLAGAVLLALTFFVGAFALDAVSLVRGPLDQVSFPTHELIAVGLVVAVGIPLHLVFARWLGARPARSERWWFSASPRAFAWGSGALAAVALAVIRYGVLGEAPLTDDEWAYRFQAQIFAEGALWAPAPPDATRFDYLFLAQHEGRWFCFLQPGLALILTPGEWLLGDGYLSLLLVNAALVPAVAGLARALLDERSARLAAALTLASPWYLLNGATVEPYAPLALAVVLFARLVIAGRGARGLRDGLLAGAALGALLGATLWLRGLEFGLLGLAAAAALGHSAWRRRAVRPLLAIAAGGALGLAPFVLGQLHWNLTLTGDALRPPISAFTGGVWYGFGEHVHEQHHLLRGLRLHGGNLVKAAAWLWAAPLALVAVARCRGPALGLLALAGFFWVAFLPYSLAGVGDLGPVYLFAVMPLIVVAAVAGDIRRPVFGPRGLAAAALTGLLTFLPLQLVQAGHIAAEVQRPYAAIAETAGPPRLVLVRRHFPAPTGWVFGLKPPDPWLRAHNIYVWATPADTRPGALDALAAALPGRDLIRVDFPGVNPR